MDLLDIMMWNDPTYGKYVRYSFIAYLVIATLIIVGYLIYRFATMPSSVPAATTNPPPGGQQPPPQNGPPPPKKVSFAGQRSCCGQ